MSVASIFINVTPFIWALPVLGGWVGWGVRAVKCKGLPYGLGLGWVGWVMENVVSTTTTTTTA